MNVDEILRKAKEAVEKAGIPEDLKSKAFEKAVELYSGDLAKQDNTASENHFGRSSNSNSQSEGSILMNISNKLKIEPQLLEELFYVEDDEVKIIIASGKLDSSNAGATKQLSLLVAGARQVGGLEDWTGNDIIRDVCQYFNKYDAANFAKTLAGMEDVFSFKGKGQKREVKINRPGQEKFKKIILELVGGDK